MPQELADNPHRVLSVPDAAAFLSSTKSWLDQARLRGDGPPFVRIGTGRGARVGYRLLDLQEWLGSRVRRSTSEGEG